MTSPSLRMTLMNREVKTPVPTRVAPVSRKSRSLGHLTFYLVVHLKISQAVIVSSQFFKTYINRRISKVFESI